MNVELSGPGGTASGLRVRLADTVWAGTFDGMQPVSPIHLTGRLSIDDIVAVVEVLAGLDRETAVQFIAGLFGFDPSNPPELLPFRADLATQPGP